MMMLTLAPSPAHVGLLNGQMVDLVNPDWRTIDLESLAVSLSRQVRFNGHTSRPISVLEHSFAVAQLVPPQHRLAALLHDAQEALIGDIVRPVVVAMMASGGEDCRVAHELARLKARCDQAIALAVLALAPERLCEPASTMHHCVASTLAAEMTGEPVKSADDICLAIEINYLSGWEGPARRHELYSLLLPDLAALQRAWLDCLEALAGQRFGHEGRAARATAWLWAGGAT